MKTVLIFSVAAVLVLHSTALLCYHGTFDRVYLNAGHRSCSFNIDLKTNTSTFEGSAKNVEFLHEGKDAIHDLSCIFEVSDKYELQLYCLCGEKNLSIVLQASHTVSIIQLYQTTPLLFSPSEAMDLSHVMSQPMALFSPVIRSDFNLYERKRPQPKPRTRTSTVQIAPKIAPGKEGTSLDSLLDKHQRMLMLRNRRQESRCKRRSYTYLASRCPAITETDEEENEEDTVILPQEFTTGNQHFGAAAMTMTPITTIHEASEEENPTPAPSIVASDTTSSSTRSKKKSVLGKINEWVRSRSMRKQKHGLEKENGNI